MIGIVVLLCFVGGAFAQMNCTQYCMNISMTCTGANAQFPPFSNDPEGLCLAACSTYPNNATLAYAGDSYQCRIYHLSVASQSAANAVIHCPHAGFDGGPGTCGTACDAYCDNIMAACTGANLVFTSVSQCMQECMWFPFSSTFNLSSPAIPVDDSFQCRGWHSQVATTVPVPHCLHAAPQGDSICGQPYNNYCDTIMTTCTGPNMQWESPAQCNAVAQFFALQTQTNNPNAPVTTGNSLPCRKYHASAPAASDPVTHCPHAGPLGGNYCGTECEAYCTLLMAACTSVTNATCMTNCANLTSSIGTSMASILAGKVNPGTIGCGTYYAFEAFANSSECANAISAMGEDCSTKGSGSDAFSLQASWSFIAMILLALGFSS